VSTKQTSGVSPTFMDQFADAKDTINRIKAVMEVKPTGPNWTLIAPDGRMWSGDQKQVARVLLQNIDVTQLFKDAP